MYAALQQVPGIMRLRQPGTPVLCPEFVGPEVQAFTAAPPQITPPTTS